MNGFVFFRLSYFDYSDLQLFAIFIFEVDFSETYFMTSAENSGLGASKYENPLGEDTDPPTRFVPLALAVMPRVTKNLATSLKGVFFFLSNEKYICTLEMLNQLLCDNLIRVSFCISLQRPFDERTSRFEAGRLVSTACN